jgi:hypothetical protein
VELTCHEYVVLEQEVKWFPGLTCDFWAENARRKIKTKAKAIKSVASPFGLRSGLRQDAGLKAPL